MHDLDTAAFREAGIVVFGDLGHELLPGAFKGPEGLTCLCGAPKGAPHRKIHDTPAREGWCPNDQTAPRPRPSWASYFMDIAALTATRATCDRKHVGCVIVRDNRIIAGGYNGSISGLEHCDDIGHDMHETHCVRTVHAEANAIADAARRGVALEGATAYVTALPCWLCFKLLAQAGIMRIVYGEAYRSNDELAKRTFKAAELCGIPIMRFES